MQQFGHGLSGNGSSGLNKNNGKGMKKRVGSAAGRSGSSGSIKAKTNDLMIQSQKNIIGTGGGITLTSPVSAHISRSKSKGAQSTI